MSIMIMKARDSKLRDAKRRDERREVGVRDDYESKKG
jgi:hypothetical protein